MITSRIILPSSYRVDARRKRLARCPRGRILHTVAWSSFFYAHLNPHLERHEELEWQLQDVWRRNDELWESERIACRNFFDALWKTYSEHLLPRQYPDCSVVAVNYWPTGTRIVLFEFDESDQPF